MDEKTSPSDGIVHSLDPRQLEIYKGLRSIGAEISAFYLDAVRIFNSDNLQTKSYMLAHAAREIEAGLRDVLTREGEGIEKDKAGEKYQHLKSIAVALGLDSNDPLVRKWFKVARVFHKYAHRHGVWKEPRKKSDFEGLWREFEDILFRLVGSYYSLLDRVDRILKYETPTNEMLDTLPNLLELEARRSYFFRNLKWLQWLKPLRQRGYFDPRNNPQPEEISEKSGHYRVHIWSALDYLEYVANKNNENPSDDITDLLIETINSIADYRNDSGERIENFRTDWMLTKIIGALPPKKIESKHIEFLKLALRGKWDATLVAVEIGKTLLPKFLNSQSKDLVVQLVDVILEYQMTEGVGYDKFAPLMEEYWLDDALENHKAAIAKLCSIEAAEVGLAKIKRIIKDDKQRFNAAAIPSIEDSSQTHFPEKYEYQLVRFVRDMYQLSDGDSIKGKIASLLEENHPICKRIAIHVISYHYDSLKELFWSWKGNPLDEHPLKHELYELFRANCSSFDEEQIEKVLEWIESRDYHILTGVTEDQEKRLVAYRKKEWLSSLLETKNGKVITSYEEYQKINPDEIDHPGFDSWMEFGVGLTSPVDPSVFLGKTNAQIAEYLNSYQRKQGQSSFFQEDLTQAFEAVVLANPQQFSIDLEPFHDVDQMYIYALLSGLRGAWRERKAFSWEKLVQFIVKIVESKEFWENQARDKNSYRTWIIMEIARLIEEGTRDDSHAFDPALLSQAENILLVLVQKTKSNLNEAGDLATAVINSQKGSIFLAMINYSLRFARLYRKDENDRWVESIKADFSKRLDKAVEPSLEFSFVLGQCLPSLHYLDQKWLTSNINRIFPKDNDSHWKAAFTGYIFYSRRIYKELYFLLRENAHYAKALGTSFAGRDILASLVGHICRGYLEEWEKLDDKTSLISMLVENGNSEQLSEVVHFFWRLREKLDDQRKAKVKPLWKALVQQLLKDKEKHEHRAVISNLSTWLSLIGEIDDEILGCLRVSARFLQKMDEYFFVEELLRHAFREPAKVAEIYIEMLAAGVYPDIKQKDIEETVRILYDQGQKVAADKICNMYGEKGYDFLRRIYEKHRT